ncbi:MAG: hypothetical protein N2688_00465 [Burkholderiaceae bacterium]|nr:hypothetical protein [Burkholderiaceae bacterium]
MRAFVDLDFFPELATPIALPGTGADERGRSYHSSGLVLSSGRLTTDSIGNFTLTLTNLVVGSAIRIEIAGTGALVEYRVAANSTEVFTVPAYTAGSANNDLRIKVRKASAAPRYKPYETQATALVGAQSVFIAQIPDE